MDFGFDKGVHLMSIPGSSINNKTISQFMDQLNLKS